MWMCWTVLLRQKYSTLHYLFGNFDKCGLCSPSRRRVKIQILKQLCKLFYSLNHVEMKITSFPWQGVEYFSKKIIPRVNWNMGTKIGIKRRRMENRISKFYGGLFLQCCGVDSFSSLFYLVEWTGVWFDLSSEEGERDFL